MPRPKGQKGHCSKGHVLVRLKCGRGKCPVCYDSEKHKKYMKGWYENNLTTVRKHTLKKNGWTVEMYEAVKRAQDNACAICRKKIEGNLRSDHKHTVPPKPRGLLCDGCNLILGHAKDSPSLLDSAAAYLRKYGEQ